MSTPVSKTLSDIRTELFGKISDLQEEGQLPQTLNLNKGVVRGLIELWSWGLYQLYQFLIAVFEQTFATLATGSWLDLICEQVNITRKTATKSQGSVMVSREDTEGNIIIPKGAIFKTKADGTGDIYRFVATARTVLQAGSSSCSVPVESESYGDATNVTTGMICEMATVIDGIDAVTNTSDWLTREAIDKEEDDQLRERYVLAWQALNGVTAAAYKSWALGVDGVIAVTVMDQHPRGDGTVDVLIKGSAGLPTQALINEVAEVVELQRPINDDALVLGPTAVYVTVTGELVLVSGTADSIVSEATTRIQALFQDTAVLDDVTALEIGEDLPLDRLTHLVMAVTGVKKVNWGMGDVEVAEDSLAVLESVDLTYIWADEA